MPSPLNQHKAKPFGGQAASFLDKLTREIIPKAEERMGIVLSNERLVHSKGIVTYLPIYYLMFLEHQAPEQILL